MQIPNQVPEHTNPIRLACIFLKPAKEDKLVGLPYNCPNGLLIRNLLRQFKIQPQDAFLGYLNNYISTGVYNPQTDEAQISAALLRRDLLRFKPNCILIFGSEGLRAAGRYETLNKFRGSLFWCSTPTSPFYQFKCIATCDVGTTLTTSYDNMPLMKFDIQKAIREASAPDLTSIPSRRFELDLTPDEIISRLYALPSVYALDIEGGIPNPAATVPKLRFPNGIVCLSIATSITDAFLIDFLRYSVEDTVRIILTLREVFADSSKRKILQNGLYDAFVLAWEFHIFISNFWWDTQSSGFELYPELRKSLANQTSLYTNEPYYKDEGDDPDPKVARTYCCKDSCVTYEIALKHSKLFTAAQHAHFRFNMDMLPALFYMELRGMQYDRERSDAYLDKVKIQMSELQVRINTRVGYAINLNSPKQLNQLLYSQLGLPKQHPPKKTGHGLDKTKLTSNIDAILNLAQKADAPILHEILAWRKLEKLRSFLEIKTDRDGRVRGSYVVVGTETNRLSCSKANTGNGANLQTITKKLRPCYSAGPSISKHTPGPRYFFQIDLSGADGWTVAAHCNRLGDPTMLLDYLAGIKPARVIGLMYLRGAEVSKLSRSELNEQSLIVGQGEHEALYFTCKQVQHGTNYYLGHAKMAQLIVKSSYKQLGKAIRVSTSMCATLQDLYLARYKGVKRWQTYVENEVKTKGFLVAASGHTRTFLGRRNNSETYRKAYAHEPQHNTTYATNRAILNLWNDVENRLPDGALIIEPHHQVHDALNGSFPVERLDWALPKLRSYFNFTIPIAGQDICIPFEGEYGEYWGHTIGKI